MELLVCLLAAWIMFEFFAILVYLAGFFCVLIYIYIESFRIIFFTRKKQKNVSKVEEVPKETANNQTLKKVFSVFTIIAIATIIIVNLFFVEEAVRFATNKIGKKYDMVIDYNYVNGSFIEGSIELADIKIDGNGDGKSINLNIKNILVDVSMSSLLVGDFTFEKVYINGSNGDFVLDGSDGKRDSKQLSVNGKTNNDRDFKIEDLNITDMYLNIQRKGQNKNTFEIAEFSSKPFTSKYAVFSALFRSNIKAKVNGQDVLIVTEMIEEGRVTSWDIKDMPVNALAKYINKVPFRWFDGGTVDIHMVDRWQKIETTDIKTEWEVVLKGVKVKIPEDAGTLEKIFAAPMAKVVNSKEEDVRLSFTVDFDKDKFENSASIDASGFWDALIKSFVDTFYEEKKDKEQKEDIAGKVKDKFKALKDRYNQK